jgi:hypothetical protein
MLNKKSCYRGVKTTHQSTVSLKLFFNSMQCCIGCYGGYWALIPKVRKHSRNIGTLYSDAVAVMVSNIDTSFICQIKK